MSELNQEVFEDFGGKPKKTPKPPKPPKAPKPAKEQQPVKTERAVPVGAVQGDYELHHIGVLDGIRAVAILVIVWYHLWQQSWLMPIVGPVNLDWLPRNGSILVDMMILLSGFCLFLPYAREMVYGERAQSTSDFYIKRVARIMPSYYVAVIIALVVGIALGGFVNLANILGDLLPHLIFLHNWFIVSTQATQLNAVLWTVAVEVQFYLFFPLIVKCFRRKPIATYLVLVLIGLVSSWLIGHNYAHINQAYWVNNTFTFASVYANGILGAYAYVWMTRDRKRNRGEAIFFTALAIACLWLYKIMCSHRMSYISETKWQVDYRYLLSLLNMAFIISTIFAVRWFRLIWDNRVMKFLAEISFNLYIWHQYIFVKLKDFRIPGYEGDVPPNQLGDTAWQWKYTIICLVAALAVATLMTYLIERPLAKWIKNRFVEG